MSDLINNIAAVVEPQSPLEVERDNARRKATELQDQLNTANLTISTMRSDWEKLNEFMNAHADHERWCSEYDEKLDYWNSSFSLLKLVSRIKTFDVDVRVVATYRTTVSVRAVSSDAAIDIVNEKDTSDVMINERWSDPYDVEFECVDVQESDD